MKNESAAQQQIDFAIVGQPKSGTTALAHFLSQHPQVCLSRPKEPEYFATDLMRESDELHGKSLYFLIRAQEDYDKCFKHCENGRIKGEASIVYAYSKEAARNIYQHNPSAKIIIMLRSPVDFMHSMHMQLVNNAVETETDFARAIELESERKKGQNIPSSAKYPSSLFYTNRARYYEQLKRYYDIFPNENILALTNEEFRRDNDVTFKKVLDFLGVDVSFSPDFDAVHGSKKPRLATLNALAHSPQIKKPAYKMLGPRLFDKLGKVTRSITLKEHPRESLNPVLEDRLIKELLPDIERTSQLLGRDLAREWSLKRENDS